MKYQNDSYILSWNIYLSVLLWRWFHKLNWTWTTLKNYIWNILFLGNRWSVPWQYPADRTDESKSKKWTVLNDQHQHLHHRQPIRNKNLIIIFPPTQFQTFIESVYFPAFAVFSILDLNNLIFWKIIFVVLLLVAWWQWCWWHHGHDQWMVTEFWCWWHFLKSLDYP